MLIKTYSRALMSLGVVLAMSGCASNPDREGPEIGCMQCGEIIDIRPANSSGVGAPAAPGTQPSARVLQPTRRLGLNAPATTRGPSLMDATTGHVRVYRVPEMSRLTRRADVVLRMDHGGVETLLVEDAHTLKIGERVRRVGNRLMPEAAGAEAP